VASIVILEHPIQHGLESSYLLYALVELWRLKGHRITIHRGAEHAPPGDLAILHVDLSVIPVEYQEAMSIYPRVLNRAVLDIRKSTISHNLVTPSSDWPHAVVVKTDANHGGQPEQRLHKSAPGRFPAGPVLDTYPILPSVQSVPQETWNLPGLVVEKFLPEQDERGFYIRGWTFFGDRERSGRSRATMPIVKSRYIVEREEVEVPEEIRALRTRLGFDFGKFDYVRHDGKFVLLDANRSPAMPSGIGSNPERYASIRALGEGLDALLR